MEYRLICTNPTRCHLRNRRIHIVALQTSFTENRPLPVYNLSIYHMIEGEGFDNDGGTLKGSISKVGTDRHSLIPITAVIY